MTRDLTHHILAALALSEKALSDDAEGPAISLLGFHSCAFAGTITAINGTADLSLIVQESDNGTDFTAASADDVHGETVDVDGATSAVSRPFQIGYRGTKPYVRLAVVYTAGAADVHAVLIKGDPFEAPTY